MNSVVDEKEAEGTVSGSRDVRGGRASSGGGCFKINACRGQVVGVRTALNFSFDQTTLHKRTHNLQQLVETIHAPIKLA